MFYILISTIVLLSFFLSLKYKYFGNNLANYLRNNMSTKSYELGLATSAHWMFAIAIFFGTGIAYKFGYIGLLFFCVPNILSLVWMGLIASAAKKKDDKSKSLIEFIENNCSKRVSYFFQLELLILALSALTLTFIAIKKIYSYSGMEASTGIDANYLILIVLIASLMPALFGGIKTSIVSGVIQGLLWIVFCVILLICLTSNSDISLNASTGSTNLTNFFDNNFLNSFGIFTFISLTVGATSHGSLWMKSYSSASRNQLNPYIVAALIFGFIVITISLASLSYVSIDPMLEDVQISIVKIVEFVGGKYLLGFLVLLVILHSSSLIDAYSNYCSNFITVDNKLFADSKMLKIKILTSLMIIASYLFFISGVSIWAIFGFMSIARIVNFFPLIEICFSKKINEAALFWIICATIFLSFSLFIFGKVNKIDSFVMWSGVVGFILPFVLIHLTKKKI